MSVRHAVPMLAALAACGPAARRAPAPEGPPDRTFADPGCAPVRGYQGDAMEPFVTRDGRYLLFNSSNAPDAQTDLHVARIDGDLAFEYVGPLRAVNSAALDGVPTVALDGRLFFVSTRSYATSGATIYAALFTAGVAGSPALVVGLPHERGVVLFDVEVSADGDRLYYSRGVFRGGPVPRAASVRAAIHRGNTFVPDSAETAALAAVNAAGALSYAAALSVDRRELFFTRTAGGPPTIYRSIRPTTQAPFGLPGRMAALDGFVEAPALSPDGGLLYYHARVAGHFQICRLRRARRAPPNDSGRGSRPAPG